MSISRVYRILRIITILQGSRGYTADELASELDVSRRTVFRDLNMLEMARIPYYFDPQTKGYRISPNFFLPPINLSIGEALAILVMTARLRNADKLPLLTNARRAATKIENSLPSAIRSQIAGILDKLSISIGPISDHTGTDDVFERLTAAMAGREVCRIRYRSLFEGSEIDTDIRPLKLVFMSRAWYLIAHSGAHEEFRTFKLSRIISLTVTKKTFQPVPLSKIDAHFGNAWSMIPEGKTYDVRLRFDAKMARNVAEVQWHASQQLQWNDDGSVDYSVQVDGLGEIGWWILGYGPHVQVLSPPVLRKRIASAAKEVLKHYESDAKV